MVQYRPGPAPSSQHRNAHPGDRSCQFRPPDKRARALSAKFPDYTMRVFPRHRTAAARAFGVRSLSAPSPGSAHNNGLLSPANASHDVPARVSVPSHHRFDINTDTATRDLGKARGSAPGHFSAHHAKTHRGLAGRVQAGKSGGGLCYGYDVVRSLDKRGDPVRGDRIINQQHAAVVRRIFTMFAAGSSPIAIAKALNADGIPGPEGRTWRDTTIRVSVRPPRRIRLDAPFSTAPTRRLC